MTVNIYQSYLHYSRFCFLLRSSMYARLSEMVMRIFAGDPGQDKEPRALDDADVGGLAKLLGKESASFGKMKEIVKRGESSGSGTLTFWP